jgi:hypothetical protein
MARFSPISSWPQIAALYMAETVGHGEYIPRLKVL